MGLHLTGGGSGGTALTSYATQVAALPDYPTAFPSSDEVSIVVYSGSVGTTRPGAEFVVWQGYPTQPTNMADGDLWLSDLGGTVLNGTAAPTGTDGANGDFYIRTTTSMLYGPKAAGSWPAGVSLVGAAGSNGTNGRGITSIARTSGTGAAGTTDTYTITYSDSTTSTFTVVNGADGAGGGSSLTVQDEGTPLSTAATTINFAGTGVAATGTGATKTVTVTSGDTGVKPTGYTYQTFTRFMIASGATMVSGTLYLTAVHLPAGASISKIKYRSGSTGSTSLTHSFAGLFDANRVALAFSNDDTTTWASSADREFTLTSAQTGLAEGDYYVGICQVATTPALIMCTSGGGSAVISMTPIAHGTSNTGLTAVPGLPFTATAITAAITACYAALA